MNVKQMVDRISTRYKNIRPPTKDIWYKSIKPIATMDVMDVTDDVATNYLDFAESNWSEGTVKMRIGMLKGLWVKARKKKIYRGENPWLDLDDGLRVPRRKPTCYPWGHYSYYHNDPYFVCLWYSGMRIGELAGIYPENIITDAQIPYFNLVHQENRALKNDESVRRVPIHPACRPFVDRLILSKAKHPGRSWSESFRKNMGLPKFNAAHTLRHSFCTRMRDAGADPYVLDVLTGHALPTVTGDYGNFSLEVLSRELQKLR